MTCPLVDTFDKENQELIKAMESISQVTIEDGKITNII